MPERAYADIMGNFRRGMGRQRSGAGDYEGAMRADPDNAESYAALADRQRQAREREIMQGARQSYGQALAGGDYDSAQTIAGKVGDVEGVAGARDAQQQVSDQQRLELYRGASQGLAEMEQIAAANGEGYEAFIARGRQALQSNPDMDPELRRLIESAPPTFNPNYVGAFRTYARRLRDSLLTPQQLADLELRRENQQNEGWSLDAYGRPYQMQGGIIRRRDEQGNIVQDNQPVPVPRDRVPGPTTYGESGLTAAQIAAEQQFASGWRPVYDNFAEIRDSYQRIQTAASQRNAAGDLALVVAFTKLLDPGSVAREGEVALTQSAASMLARAQTFLPRLQRGNTLLPDSVRAELVATARDMYGNYQEAYDRLADDYGAAADQYGFDRARVMRGYQRQTGGDGDAGGANALPPPAQRVRGQRYQMPDGGSAEWDGRQFINPQRPGG